MNSDTQIDILKLKHIHFMGIGGVSMSGLAQMAKSQGITVTGSDIAESELTKKLEDEGIKVFYGQKASNISKDMDLVVYTAAIGPDNEELGKARELNINTMVRADYLGLLMKMANNVICISGTDGKTTTTAMISHIMLETDFDPTVMVGGMYDKIGGNLRIGKSSNMIVESCEYKDSFLSFFPTTAVILNIREDHLDYFKDINHIRRSFKAFADKEGVKTLVICNEIDNVSDFTKDAPYSVITYGKGGKYEACDITFDEFARPSYTLLEDGKEVTRLTLGVTGEHNVTNSLAAIAVCRNYGVSYELIEKLLPSFHGTDRRFQILGECNGATVIDDYAHNPDEIRATLKTLSKFKHNDSYVVFQPHTYTRTKSLLKEFATELSNADHIILAKIYPAREKDIYNISSQDLADKIKALGKSSIYMETFEEIEKYLKNSCSHGDVILTMGAGDVVNIAKDLIE